MAGSNMDSITELKPSHFVSAPPGRPQLFKFRHPEQNAHILS